MHRMISAALAVACLVVSVSAASISSAEVSGSGGGSMLLLSVHPTVSTDGHAMLRPAASSSVALHASSEGTPDRVLFEFILAVLLVTIVASLSNLRLAYGEFAHPKHRASTRRKAHHTARA
jgi:hypothetical protein